MFHYGVLAATVLVFYILTSLVQANKRYHHAQKLGCKPADRRRNRWPGGIDHLMRLWEANNKDMIPKEALKIYAEQSLDTWEQRIVGARQIFTANPRNIQAVLSTQFLDFEIGHNRRRFFIPLLGNGIFTQDGKPWEHSRAMLRPQFTRTQISDLDLVERHAQVMFRHFESRKSGWTQDIDLGPLFFRLTIDTATEFLFGKSVQSQLHSLLEQGQEHDFEWKHLPDNFDRGTMGIGIRFRLADLYWLYNPLSFRNSCKEVHRFADHYVQLALEKEKKGTGVSEEKQGYVFLHELVKLTKDPVELRSQLLNIFVAGRDTTASLMGRFIWILARNPDVFQKLRTIILDTFGTYHNPGDITFERLKNCSYLQYTMNETLRLFPNVPLNARICTKDTSLPYGGGPDGKSPVFVRKGDLVNYWVGAMHRRKDLWGSDADSFNPDRWYNRKAGWEYLPFNGGPRICLGQQFALTEAGYVLTRLIQKFDKIENCDPNDEPLEVFSITTSPKRVLVRLHDAEKA